MHFDCWVFMQPQKRSNKSERELRLIEKHKPSHDTYKHMYNAIYILQYVGYTHTHTHTHQFVCAICGAFDWIHLKCLFGNRKCMERERVQFID